MLKGNKSTKEKPRELLMIAGRSGKIHIIKSQPCTCQQLVQKRMPFANWLKTKPADIASIQNWKSGQTVSFLHEATDISFLNAFAKSAETEMNHFLSVYSRV